jgi:hypothetical protein
MKFTKITYDNGVHGYLSLYLPSIGYGMCATVISTKECEDIQRTVISAILLKIGINRKAAHIVVFGTAQFGGLGLDHLDRLKGHSRLHYLMDHLHYGNHTGQLTRILLEYTQLKCGTMDNILEQDYNKFSNSIINKNWITEIWKPLHICKATVTVQQTRKPRMGCTNNIAIMDCMMASNKLARGELQDTNRCRIYLHVLFLSDIKNIQGTLIKPWAISGQRTLTRKTSWA